MIRREARWIAGPAATIVLLSWVAESAGGQLVPAGNHRIFQDQLGGAIEAGDRFGGALAAGDFDGDGILDLAIGAPGEEINGMAAAGAVFVVYGSVDGLGAGPRSPLLIHQDVDGVEGAAEAGDGFGSVLVAGDINGDGNDELIVGIPSEDVGAVVDAGAIQVFLGTAGGLTTLGDVLLTGGTFVGVGDIQGHRFGAALATGYLNIPGTDARLDLVVGIPGGALAPLYQGTILWIPGSATGLDPTFAFHALGPFGQGDRTGSALAVGDVDDDAAPGDMIIGAPFAEQGSGDTEEGLVWILAEAATGYSLVPLGPGPQSHYGSTIVLGDFVGAGYQQMLLGAPDAEADMVAAAGAVVLYDEKEQTFAYIIQDPGRSFGTPDPLDHFGRVLAVGDFDGDGFDDAAFGVPFEDLMATGGGGEIVDVGIVQVLYGSADGLRYDNNQLWRLDGPIGFFELPDDNFGGALAAGDFDGDGADDLAIGVPGAFWIGQDETGFVQILYGFTPLVFADDFESGDDTAWE
jgi:FG-GAP repeat